MPGITIAVPTDDPNARMHLAAQLAIAAASLMPRVKDYTEAIDITFALYSRMYAQIGLSERPATVPQAGNP